MINISVSARALVAARAVDPDVSTAAVRAAVEVALAEQLRELERRREIADDQVAAATGALSAGRGSRPRGGRRSPLAGQRSPPRSSPRSCPGPSSPPWRAVPGAVVDAVAAVPAAAVRRASSRGPCCPARVVAVVGGRRGDGGRAVSRVGGGVVDTCATAATVRGRARRVVGEGGGRARTGERESGDEGGEDAGPGHRGSFRVVVRREPRSPLPRCARAAAALTSR